MRGWPWIAGLGAAGIATVVRMRDELHTDGGLDRATAAVLDALYVAHLGTVVAVGATDPRQPLESAVPITVGVATAVAGVAVTATSMGLFPSVSQVNAIEDDELVVDGIYRYSRNPQYLGWCGVLLGTALALRSPRALALAAVYPTVVSWWVRQEERHLEDRFGERYRRYRRATPRWLGRPAPASH